MSPFLFEECCAMSRYQGQGQVITSHIIGEMQLHAPALDTCFWLLPGTLHSLG